MKSTLLLDGGGIRGMFTLRILSWIEELQQVHHENPDAVLVDTFDRFAGNSTGIHIVAGLEHREELSTCPTEIFSSRPRDEAVGAESPTVVRG